MEKSLLKLTNNKHLVYLIQEYTRKEYKFLKELENNTLWLLSECDKCYFYTNYIKGITFNWYERSFTAKIYYDVGIKWDIKYIMI
jgi:hypothetical protein